MMIILGVICVIVLIVIIGKNLFPFCIHSPSLCQELCLKKCLFYIYIVRYKALNKTPKKRQVAEEQNYIKGVIDDANAS